jgi:hypothetical protein
MPRLLRFFFASGCCEGRLLRRSLTPSPTRAGFALALFTGRGDSLMKNFVAALLFSTTGLAVGAVLFWVFGSLLLSA